MRFIVALALSGCFAASALADSAKQPWLWTIEERVAARRDPSLRAQRIREATTKAHEPERARIARQADMIDGTTHPELFFATELFEGLIRRAFVTLPDTYPRFIRQQSSDLFIEESDWEQFAAMTADAARAISDERNAASDPNLQARKCAAIARALRSARNAFGRERFDRMLYTVVAPGSLIAIGGADPNATIERRIQTEERCQ